MTVAGLGYHAVSSGCRSCKTAGGPDQIERDGLHGVHRMPDRTQIRRDEGLGSRERTGTFALFHQRMAATVPVFVTSGSLSLGTQLEG